MRKDMNPDFAKFLANIQSKFVFKIIDKNEADIVSKGLSYEECLRVEKLKLYNCLQIEDSRIKQEFKGYFLEQTELLQWINNNFKKDMKFKNDKISNYYNHAKNINNISMKEAMGTSFNLTRSEWDNFIQELEKSNEIVRNKDNSIDFKN